MSFVLVPRLKRWPSYLRQTQDRHRHRPHSLACLCVCVCVCVVMCVCMPVIVCALSFQSSSSRHLSAVIHQPCFPFRRASSSCVIQSSGSALFVILTWYNTDCLPVCLPACAALRTSSQERNSTYVIHLCPQLQTHHHSRTPFCSDIS